MAAGQTDLMFDIATKKAIAPDQAVDP